MATFSVQDPIRGDFVYFDGPSLAAINDDQPIPRFASEIVTSLGVPSILAGRPMPQGCKERGRGTQAKGYISTGKLAGKSNFAGGGDPSLGLAGVQLETVAGAIEPFVPMLAAAAGGLVGLRAAGGARGAKLLVLPAVGAILGHYIAKNVMF